jgi:CRISPR-associated protein (TIGR02584 family)
MAWCLRPSSDNLIPACGEITWMKAWREILVVVAGLTPQVITEALYYLTQVRDPPLTIDDIYVLTTSPGQRRILDDLLTPDLGHFYTLCSEYQLDPSTIDFDADHINVLTDAAGAPLEDIRTADDNAAVADQILALMRRLTAAPTTRLHCSLAGGRKTQSVLLGFALQLYGRPQDTLLHVLVDEAFEGSREFFYPTRASQLIRSRDGRRIDAHTACVDVAGIPYVRLHDKLSASRSEPASGFAPTIEQLQYTLNTLPDLPMLVIEPAARNIHIGVTPIALEPLGNCAVCPAGIGKGAAAGTGGWILEPERAEWQTRRDVALPPSTASLPFCQN